MNAGLAPASSRREGMPSLVMRRSSVIWSSDRMAESPSDSPSHAAAARGWLAMAASSRTAAAAVLVPIFMLMGYRQSSGGVGTNTAVWGREGGAWMCAQASHVHEALVA